MDPPRPPGARPPHISRRKAALAGAVALAALAAVGAWLGRDGRARPVEGPAQAAAPARPAQPAAPVEGQVVDELGSPVTGARLWASDIEAPPGAAAREEVRSDDKGAFRFGTLPAGRYRLDAEAENHAPAAMPELLAPGTGVRLVLERTATLSGQVVREDGTGVAGAEVTVAGSGVWPPRQLAAGAEGRFRLPELPGGVYELRARHEGYSSDPEEGLVIEPGKSAEVVLTLLPGAPLRGRVYDAETGAALAGADVVVGEDALSALPLQRKTDGEGRFEVLGLRPRPHRVSILLGGYTAVTGQSRDPGTAVHKFPLRRAGTLSGRVLDEDGAAVAGAELEVVGTTDVGTALRLSPTPQAQTLGSAPPTALSLASPDNLGVVPGEVPKVPLYPTPAAQAPAKRAAAAATGRASLLPPLAHGTPVTGADGTFRIEGVPPGSMRVLARRNDYAPGQSDDLQLTSGQQLEDIRVVLPRGGTLRGRVVDSRGFPVAQVRLDLHCEREPWPRMTLSDAGGELRFEAVLGRCTLTANARGLPPQSREVGVSSGDTIELELTLETEIFELSGRVVDGRGFPVDAAVLRVARAADSAAALTTVSDASGAFMLTGLGAPPYRVRAEREGYAPVVLDGVSLSKQGLTVTLGRGAAIEGLVRDAFKQTPLPGARVVLAARAADGRLVGLTNALGRFEFHNLTPGKYEVSIEKRGFVSEHREAALVGGEAAFALEPVALGPAGSLSGEVVDRLGAPVFNAEVAVGRPAAWASAVRTDYSGAFRFEALPPGEHVLSSRHPEGGEVELRYPIKVFELQESPGTVLRLPDVVPLTAPPRPSAAEELPPPEGERATGEPDDVAQGSAAEEDAEGGRGAQLAFGYSDGAVRVTAVPAGSAAARAGLRPGDIVVAVDEEPVLAVAQARAMLSDGPGAPRRLTLEVRRGKQLRRLKLTHR